MKAVLCSELAGHERLRVTEVARPALERGSVRVRMRLAAINTPDLLMARGAYQVRPEPPFIPGVEGMGIVTETSADAAGLAPGTRVMTYPGIGCFAQEAVVPAHLAAPVPDDMPDTVAAGFILAYGTAWHGLQRGALARGDTLVVLGAAGGVGTSAIQVGKALGARVIAVASTRAKCEACIAGGADAAIDSTTEAVRERIRELTGARGADVVFDAVGGDLTEATLRSLAPYGRLLVIGFAGGTIPAIRANLVLLKQTSVVGVSFRQFFQQRQPEAAGALRELCGFWRRGMLQAPPQSVYPIDDVVAAMEKVARREAIGKVLLAID